MKIYSMTATFGKLDRKTLKLEPGLNIIEAPNEWGKSTWCAFLVNMLYGINTSERTKQGSIADKEHYAPWSGAAMSGRIDLNWNGRDITIERTSRKVPFGEFQAYETESGLPVEELNGANCGMMLLGVERSVFVRSGFLTLNDLPVTQDDALRRRLNNLVTTGDESGAGDKLQQKLKELKNKCRSNTKTGLLPQAEAQRRELENQLYELVDLNTQSENLKQRQAELEKQVAALENHQVALQYAAAKEDAAKVRQAESICNDAQKVYEGLCASCDGLPDKEQTQQALAEGQALQRELLQLQSENQALPPLPQVPNMGSQFANTTPEQAIAAAQADLKAVGELESQRAKRGTTLIAVGVILFGAAVCGFALGALAIIEMMAGIICGAVAAITAVATLIANGAQNKKLQQKINEIHALHPGIPADQWVAQAQNYADTMAAYRQELDKAKAMRGDLDSRQELLNKRLADYVGDDTLNMTMERHQQILESLEALANARKELENAQKHLQILRSMARTAEAPKEADHLTYTEVQTAQLLTDARFELRQAQMKLGQYQGRCEALGQEAAIRAQLKAVSHRIEKLENYYDALEMAQQALSKATSELQRRFAPRISKRAQELFRKMTHGRYDRLSLSEDLSVKASSVDDLSMQSALWCSDGTADQLYLSLRLAVSEELTPDAPLVLDDALVRFDENRLKAALDILQESAENKQVILFTCQTREKALLGESK